MKTFEEWCQDREIVLNELSPKFVAMAYKVWGEDCFVEGQRYEAENAALRERLEKTVELKVKVGDKIYCIHRTSDPIIIEWQVDEIRITDHNCILHLVIAGTKNYRNEPSQYYGKWWFTTREAAEARLTELKGGKE